ncbi:MAG: N-acetylmuramidase family protein [Pseudomonadota bacterium]
MTITPLTRAELEAAAKELGGPVSRLRAVIKIESNGKPGAKLFEPHIFYRYIKHDDDKRDKAVSEGFAHPRWRGVPYRIWQFNKAFALDKTAALKSTSWGLFQIMGFNHEVCGYDDVHSFVKAMNRSVGEQVKAVVKFIKHNKRMHQAYLDADWKTFAKHYNGPAYYKNKYHIKLANAAVEYQAKELARQESKESESPNPVTDTVKNVGAPAGALAVLTAFISELLTSANLLKAEMGSLESIAWIVGPIITGIVIVAVCLKLYVGLQKLNNEQITKEATP